MKKQWLIGAAAAALIAGLAGGYGILENKGAAGADNEPEIVLCYGEVNPEGLPALVGLVRNDGGRDRPMLAAVLGPLVPPERLYGNEQLLDKN